MTLLPTVNGAARLLAGTTRPQDIDSATLGSGRATDPATNSEGLATATALAAPITGATLAVPGIVRHDGNDASFMVEYDGAATWNNANEIALFHGTELIFYGSGLDSVVYAHPSASVRLAVAVGITLSASALASAVFGLLRYVIETLDIDALSESASIDKATQVAVAGRGQSTPTKSTVGDLLNVFIPPGAIIDYAGTVAPSEWLLCDGSARSRTTYASLFAAIGTRFGAGDGSTTFNLPDARGRVTAGVDGSAGRMPAAISDLGESGGADDYRLTTAEMPAHRHPHTHTYTYTSLSAQSPEASTSFQPGRLAAWTSGAFYRISQVATRLFANPAVIYLTGGEGGSANPNPVSLIQPTLVVNKIIKT